MRGAKHKEHFSFLALCLCCFSLLIIISCKPGMAYAALNSQQADKAFDSYLSAHQDELFGLGLSYISPEENSLERYFGYSSFAQDKLFDEDTLIDWGRASELVVWLAAFQLSEQGKLDFSADIRPFLSEKLRAKFRFKEALSFYDLMNQSSGFGSELFAAVLSKGTQRVQLEDYLISYASSQAYQPGRLHSPSSFNAGLGALIIEKITGLSFKDYAQRNIFDPLRMNSAHYLAFIDERPGLLERRLSQESYNSQGIELGSSMQRVALYPALGLCSDLKDIARLVRALLDLSTETVLQYDDTYKSFWTSQRLFGDEQQRQAASGFVKLPSNEELWFILSHSKANTLVIEINPSDRLALISVSNVKDDTGLVLSMPDLVFSRESKGQSVQKLYDSHEFSGVYQASNAAQFGFSKLFSVFGRKFVRPLGDKNLALNFSEYQQYEPGLFVDPSAPQHLTQLYFSKDAYYGAKLSDSLGDYLRLPLDRLLFEYSLLVLWLLAYCAAFVLSLLSVIRHYQARKRGFERNYLRISFLLNLLMLAQGSMILYASFQVYKGLDLAALHVYVLASYACVILLALGIALMLRDYFTQDAKIKQRLLKLISMFSALVFVLNLFYWDIVF